MLKRYYPYLSGGGLPVEVTMKEAIDGEYVSVEELKREVEKLYELVDGMDIPSPTIPEYIEWHRNCQEILAHIRADFGL